MQALPALGFYGTPGLIDMPTAYPMPDGEVSLSTDYFADMARLALTFQITPRLSGSFRYALIDDFRASGGSYFDRSFDLDYVLAMEGPTTPGLKIGLRDFGGTGIYASEYLVASKTFDTFQASLGLGWGRLGSYNGFSNPLGFLGDRFDDRGGISGFDETGQVDFGQWFSGPAAVFGGLQYRPNDQVVLSMEYSSDAYVTESERTGFEHNSPINVAATYRFRNGVDLSAAYLYGSYAGVLLSYHFNPKAPPGPAGGREGPGPQVVPRSAAALGWDSAQLADAPVEDSLSADLGLSTSGGGQAAQGLEGAVSRSLAGQGIEMLAFERESGSSVRIWLRNNRWQSEAQALGRAGRALTAVLPPEVDTMVLIPTRDGIALSAVTLRRSDLEELEEDLDGSWKTFARAQVVDAAQYPMPRDYFPRYGFGVGLYGGPTLSNPDSLLAEAGLRFDASYTLLPGFSLSTQIRQPVLRTGSGESPTGTSSKIAPVRSDAGLFEDSMDPEITELKADYFFRPGVDLYGRLSMGYLEKMYGGLSGEVLWKPVASPLALGLELNYAQKRDPDSLLGIGDYDTMTGYASAYYDFGGGYMGRVDAGRYLAQDWGTTVALDREFGNGFLLGAYFTLTDVPFDDFGEGSFDKGIRFSIPLTWLTGEPSRRTASTTWRPINGDGGARMQISNRLYNEVRSGHLQELRDGWGRFWR
ncbi:YjbH domain-containing protein [Pseudooceanicola sp. HF7]|uniref:YjbH domain-containing protein n=1 Tax=Pseudooceanicola sp. HF7 TaxID=2721560 RepID=UPI0014313CA1|nr:YjbH domain-containing protein [Pseudooceanicola sp. HF7]NIZ10964.1 YjbH domain-containing protein [Pseudooceanicola sp. HF7]